MRLRFLALLFAASAGELLGQTGLYGPVTARPKAGDFAPGIVIKAILSAPTGKSWTSANLTGEMTVVTFYPDTSHNLQSVSAWNALVEQFAGRHVQFVWITGEKESSLLPWLKAHPIKGWVFHDPDGSMGRAYGMELPAAVIIGNDGRILGFDRMMVPSAHTLDAALEGRITTTPLKSGNAAFRAFVEDQLVLLQAEPPRMPGENDHRPEFPPSYTVHITPSTSGDGGQIGSYS